MKVHRCEALQEGEESEPVLMLEPAAQHWYEHKQNLCLPNRRNTEKKQQLQQKLICVVEIKNAFLQSHFEIESVHSEA